MASDGDVDANLERETWDISYETLADLKHVSEEVNAECQTLHPTPYTRSPKRLTRVGRDIAPVHLSVYVVKVCVT